jgi:hypothetical protein
MFNPDTASASTYIPSFETAGRSLKVAPIIEPVHNDTEIETAIIALGREPGGGLVNHQCSFIATQKSAFSARGTSVSFPA